MNIHRFAGVAVRTAWVLAMLAVLAMWLVGGSMRSSSEVQQPDRGSEQHMIAIIALVALTFPIGLAFAAVLNVTAYALALSEVAVFDSGILSNVIVWVGFVVLGYFQWFRFVPWLWSRWMQRVQLRRRD